MAIENCARCGNLFQRAVKDLCPKCVVLEEEDFKKVRLFIKRYKNVELAEVSRETGVDLNLIYRFLRESRLALNPGATASYPCEKCGDPIQSGAICTPCSKQIQDVKSSIREVITEQPKVETVSSNNKKSGFYSRLR